MINPLKCIPSYHISASEFGSVFTFEQWGDGRLLDIVVVEVPDEKVGVYKARPHLGPSTTRRATDLLALARSSPNENVF